MLKRILIAFSLSCSILSAADNIPSEASIKQLFVLTEDRKLSDEMLKQMEATMKTAMQQVTQGKQVTPELQKDTEKIEARLMKFFKEELDWNKLEPFHVRVYQQSYTQQEIDGLLAFYKTPAGQALIKKQPVVLRNTMAEMQKTMGPMMQRLEQMQQEVAAKIQAEQAKKG